MKKHLLLVLAVLGVVLAQGCATTQTGPATVFTPAGGVVRVPAGEKIIPINIGDPTKRGGYDASVVSVNDVFHHAERMAEIDQRAQSDAYRHDETIHRDNVNAASRALDTISRGAQDRQRERTYRSQNLQRTATDAYRSYVNSGGQKVAPPRPIYSAPRLSAPRAIRAPQIRPIRQR